ncbi:hypothetical protein J4208_01800 [Candidatus Woesearchaeota archaeon]|nr:hypothetical protein [Candidatus Woesearchaeota archaeon]
MKKLNLSWLKDYIISYFSGIYTAIVVVLSMKDGQINNWSLFIFGLFWFIVGGVLLAFLFHRNKELLPQTEQEKSEKKDNDFNIDYQKLLDFYRDLFYKDESMENEVIKKYGVDINEYLKREGQSHAGSIPPILYAAREKKYKKFSNFSNRIRELENKVDNIKRDNLQIEQNKTNKWMTIATIIMAIATIFIAKITYDNLQFTSTIQQKEIDLHEKEIINSEKLIEAQTTEGVYFSINLDNGVAYFERETIKVNRTKLMKNTAIFFNIGNFGQTTLKVNEIASSALCNDGVLDSRLTRGWYDIEYNKPPIILKSGEVRQEASNFYTSDLDQSPKNFPCVIIFHLITDSVTINRTMSIEN